MDGTSGDIHDFAPAKRYEYDRLGNMTYQTGIGDYKYESHRPHAITRTVNTHGKTVRSYEYDDVGNMTYRNGDKITYTPSNKATIIEGKNGKEVRFYYGVGGKRYMKKTADKQTFYLGKAYEEEQATGSNEVKSTIYISVGGKTVGTHVEVLDSNYISTNAKHRTAYNHYFHTDALGSITAITDDNGNVIERRSYEAFGKIRAMDYGLTSNNAIIPANTVKETTRAFTGHEQIAELDGLIHMNARLYDSHIGRFTSADTFIQAPHNTQSYNRYSYVLNNPLVYTDPTGHFFKKLFKWIKKNIRTIAAIVVAAVIAVYAGPLLIKALGSKLLGSIATGALAGFSSTLVATGSLSAAFKGAFWGAISAGVAWGIGHSAMFKSLYNTVGNMKAVVKALAHGLSRAAISAVRGGKAMGGFLSGFAGSLLGGVVKGLDYAKGNIGTIIKVTMTAIAGGTASVLGGGKFANGAMSAAFVVMFNHYAGGHGANRKYDREIHRKHAQMLDSLATKTSTTGAFIYPFNKVAGGALILAGGVIDGLKHLQYFILGEPDIVGLTTDYVVPISVKPLGPLVGEIASQGSANSIEYMEENFK